MYALPITVVVKGAYSFENMLSKLFPTVTACPGMRLRSYKRLYIVTLGVASNRILVRSFKVSFCVVNSQR